MARNPTTSRYARVAPATSLIAGALHSASSRMGHHLELALAAELVASEVALPWTGPSHKIHRFAMGASLPVALSLHGVQIGSHHAMADMWFMSSNPNYGPSFIIQLKSGGRLGKSQRSGEAAALADLCSRMGRAGLSVRPVLCAFDAQTDIEAVQSLGSFQGIETMSGPSMCLSLGVDYDRVNERWESCAGDTVDNDQHLANGLYASMVAHYGARVAAQMWEEAASQARGGQGPGKPA